MSEEHGTARGVYLHRRNGTAPCEPCAIYRARYEKRRQFDRDQGRPRTISSRGTQRRIRALQALGWSISVIAEEGGWNSPQALQYVLKGSSSTHATFERVCEVYERLSMKLPPVTSGSIRARNRARRLGYAPPLAWDDIDRDVRPAKTNGRVTTLDEYRELLDMGVAEQAALEALGVTSDAIRKAEWRARKVA